MYIFFTNSYYVNKRVLVFMMYSENSNESKKVDYGGRPYVVDV